MAAPSRVPPRLDEPASAGRDRVYPGGEPDSQAPAQSGKEQFFYGVARNGGSEYLCATGEKLIKIGAGTANLSDFFAGEPSV